MSTNGPPIKIKVQKRFYVLLACVGLLFLYFAWGIVKPASVNKQVQALAQPAVLAPFHYPFQSPAEEARFTSAAHKVPTSNSFYGGYPHNKALPATFIAYVLPEPPGSAAAANRFTDKNNTYTYIPAVFITPGDPNALTSAGADASGNAPNPILLAFSQRKALPQESSFVKVYGVIWWRSSLARDPNSIPASDVNSISDLPIFLVGDYQNYTSIEAQ